MQSRNNTDHMHECRGSLTVLSEASNSIILEFIFTIIFIFHISFIGYYLRCSDEAAPPIA